MKLTFRYSKEDYQELLVLKDSENLLHRRAKLINLVTIIAVIFILVGSTSDYIKPNYLPTFIVAGVFIVFWLIFSRKIYDYNRRSILNKMAGNEFSKSIDSMKDTSITLTDDYIIRELEGFYSRIEWSFVSDVIVTENNIFINLISGYIINIPRRIFNKKEEVSFLKYLDQQINKKCGVKSEDSTELNKVNDYIRYDSEFDNDSEVEIDEKVKSNRKAIYSDRIKFNNIKKDIKSGRWQKVVALILLASVVFTIGGSIIYNELNRPTEITQDEIYTLIVESELIEQKAIEEVKKTIDYEQNYVGGTYVIDIRTEKEGVILVDLGQEVNYPAAYVQLYGTATLKYKRGWYIEDIVYRENYGLEPLFTAGESFLNGLSTDIYGKGYFEYNGVKYAFAPSYVDSLCTMTEEGNFEATKVGIAPYNKDGRIDIYATMKYNFDIWAWELIDFETSGTR
ncbi:MAG: YcxB family protein [Clostridium sp.]|nr:YcxB family protein [Clostridium sp.]